MRGIPLASGSESRSRGSGLIAQARRNGLQLECLAEYPTFFRDYYYKLLARVMTFPLHTIAAINGHCFAGGLCLALACDWRLCRVGYPSWPPPGSLGGSLQSLPSSAA